MHKPKLWEKNGQKSLPLVLSLSRGDPSNGVWDLSALGDLCSWTHEMDRALGAELGGRERDGDKMVNPPTNSDCWPGLGKGAAPNPCTAALSPCAAGKKCSLPVTGKEGLGLGFICFLSSPFLCSHPCTSPHVQLV